MNTIQKIRRVGAEIWYDGSIFTPMEHRLFDPEWLIESGHVSGTAQGRAAVHFLHYEGRDMVLRHFSRGGLMGRLNRDCYMRTAVENSRPMQEFSLLFWMREQGLPVPRPLAARHVSAGLCYRADLITERIPDARALADVLREAALPASVWSEIGSVIGRVHDLGVDHSDLNCRNILLDADTRVWLIDFDKCTRRAPGPWKRRNIARLLRSLEKETRRHPGVAWTAQGKDALMAGYAAPAAIQP